MSENKFINEWKNHVLQAANALKEDDRSRYEKEIELMNEAYENYKRDNDLGYSNENAFGIAREIFESALPKLFISDKQMVRKIYSTIREDKNLSAQFMFLEALKKYKPEYDLKQYINEAFTLAQKNIDPKTVKESNNKFFNLLRKNGIKPTDYIEESKLGFYRDCDSLLNEKRTLANISTLNETFNRVSSHVEKMAQEKLDENDIKPTVSLEEFTKKINASLTESEKEILSTLLDSKNEEKKKTMFESYKKNCLQKIKSTLSEASEDQKEKLKNLYKTLSEKKYNKETILEEMITILEIANIFND